MSSDTAHRAKSVRMCYASPDNNFYDWPQTKLDGGKQTLVASSAAVSVSQSAAAASVTTPLLSRNQQETYHYGRLHLPEGQLPAQLVLNGLELYQPLVPAKNQAGSLYHPGLTVQTDVPVQLITAVSPSPASLLLQDDVTPAGNGAKFKLQNKLESGRGKLDRPDRTRHSKDDIELDLQQRTYSDSATAADVELARMLQARNLSRSTTTLQQNVKLETSFV
uniref:Uncharacterized protein n=1 Tax=Schistocephalus solidus TaxID=70667 RepID=A0A0X3NP15_SCHSO